MLDLKFIRENPDVVRQGIENKNEKNRIDEVLELDKKRREILVIADDLKSKRNRVSDEVAKLKKAKEDATALIEEMKGVGEDIKKYNEELAVVEADLNNILAYIPNLPHSSVPVGKSAADNVEVRRWLPEGYNLDDPTVVPDHLQIGKNLKILDFERGTKISGSGFPLYMGDGATLERALFNFFLDFHLEHHGYQEVMTPFIVNRDSMKGTGQIPKMEEDMYTCERDGMYLIPTAEVPITNIYRSEVLDESSLPIKYCGYSPCFRREAGSYGKDTKGFLRVHQFNKVEMVKFAKPEGSYDELEKLVNDAEDILKALNIPYRVLMLCTGDLSFSAAKCYDIEVWSPAEKKWLEASSCSNFEDFQARRANIKYRRSEDKKLEFIHTLNGSGLATSRLMVSLLENNLRPDGKLNVPEALRPYLRKDIIG
ncbi:MAG: serine--tRNA ligase [Ignavibacteria bacterium]|nr:serine--tRNA ligase [Ignavibacteria bacterium]